MTIDVLHEQVFSVDTQLNTQQETVYDRATFPYFLFVSSPKLFEKVHNTKSAKCFGSRLHELKHVRVCVAAEDGYSLQSVE